MSDAALIVTVAAQSPVVHDVPLVAVGIVVAERPLHGAVAELDRLLDGAIEKLRGRGGAALGTATLLDGAPGIQAPRVLLVGLGAAHDVTLDALTSAGALAVSQALALGVRALGFAPGLLDAGVDTLDVAAVARALVAGARAAFAKAKPGYDLDFALETSEANRAQALAGIEPAPR